MNRLVASSSSLSSEVSNANASVLGRMGFAVLLAASLLVTIAGCDSKAPPAETTPKSAPPAGVSAGEAKPAATQTATQAAGTQGKKAYDHTGWPKTIRMGLVPAEGNADTKSRWAPLGEALEKGLGVPVELISASTYQGIITAMGNDQLEFAYLGPKSYIEAANRAKAEALLVEKDLKGEPGYHCIFIVPASSAINNIKDAAGKKFAFTDVNSTSGYLVPAVTLIDLLGKPADKFFGQVTFSGSHSASLLQVAAGEIDIAATNDLDMNAAIASGTAKADAVRVIYTSEMIPGSPIACRKDIPQSLKDAYVDVVLEMSKDKATIEKLHNGGFEKITDQQFDVMRAAQKFLDSQSNADSQSKPDSPTPAPKPAG
ncbi:MAG: phosphonate ABC transporter substrate-binding protein [Tepidisphaera sp.]|nr:phosphonate ABC transporter substrate-binding protein [Tepidisphaera sp.]